TILEDGLPGAQDYALFLQRKQRARMTFRNLAALDAPLHLLRKIEQADGVRDGRTALADTLRNGLLRHAELVYQAAVGAGRLHRANVLALDVLDDRHLQQFLLRTLSDERGDRRQTRHLRSAKAPLPGDELVALMAYLSQQHRLQDAMLLDGVH